MRAIEILEGGASGAARYNSEIAFLFACAGNSDVFNLEDIKSNFDSSKLDNAENVFSEIEKFLIPNYNDKLFYRWYSLANDYMAKIIQHSGIEPTKFGWVGGSNAAPGAADIDFFGHPSAGVSIKDSGGITLSNLTPKALGIEPARGSDVFAHYAKEEFEAMKSHIFRDLMNHAKSNPNERISPLGDKYAITYVSEVNEFKCEGKKEIQASYEDIMNSVSTNAAWQRVFGDFFQANFQSMKAYSAPLYKKIASMFEDTIEKTLADSSAVANVLRFTDEPYYYASASAIYHVPSANDATDIVVKSIKYGKPDGTSQKFLANFGRQDSDDYATADIYIRYANGMFETNPTVRVQSLKNPEFISWDKL